MNLGTTGKLARIKMARTKQAWLQNPSPMDAYWSKAKLRCSKFLIESVGGKQTNKNKQTKNILVWYITTMLRFHFILCHVIKVLKNSSGERKKEETTYNFKNNLKGQEEKLMKRHKKGRDSKVCPKSQTNAQPRESQWLGAINIAGHSLHGRRGRQRAGT